MDSERKNCGLPQNTLQFGASRLTLSDPVPGQPPFLNLGCQKHGCPSCSLPSIRATTKKSGRKKCGQFLFDNPPPPPGPRPQCFNNTLALRGTLRLPARPPAPDEGQLQRAGGQNLPDLWTSTGKQVQRSHRLDATGTQVPVLTTQILLDPHNKLDEKVALPTFWHSFFPFTVPLASQVLKGGLVVFRRRFDSVGSLGAGTKRGTLL